MAEPADGTGALDALQLPPIALPQQIGRLRKMRMPFATAEVVDVVRVYSPRYREVWLPRVSVHLKLCGACRSRQGVGLCPPAYPEEALHGTFRIHRQSFIHTVLSCFPTVLCTSTEAPLWAEIRGSLLTQEPGSGNCFLVITPAATCDTIPCNDTPAINPAGAPVVLVSSAGCGRRCVPARLRCVSPYPAAAHPRAQCIELHRVLSYTFPGPFA